VAFVPELSEATCSELSELGTTLEALSELWDWENESECASSSAKLSNNKLLCDCSNVS
jgi:hypothetical protein